MKQGIKAVLTEPSVNWGINKGSAFLRLYSPIPPLLDTPNSNTIWRSYDLNDLSWTYPLASHS